MPERLPGRFPTDLALVGQVYNGGSMGTGTGMYYLVHPVTVGGKEVEGGAPTFSVDTSKSVPFYVVGSKAPVVGDYLIGHFSDHRWVAERYGGIASVPTDGFCFPNPGPATLNLTCSYTVGATTLTGDGSLVTLHVDGSGSFTDTLTFQATKPAGFPGYVDNNVYLGSGSFSADFLDYTGVTHTGASVRLALICDGSSNPVSGQYCVAVFGGGAGENFLGQNHGQSGLVRSPPTPTLVQYNRGGITGFVTITS